MCSALQKEYNVLLSEKSLLKSMSGQLQDYLAAPMPFLVGLHAPNLFASALRSSSLEEVVVVDLDRGTVRVSHPYSTCSSCFSWTSHQIERPHIAEPPDFWP